MKIKNVLLIALVLANSLTALSQAITPDRELKVITLNGSGYELGFQHGTQLKKEISSLVEKWKENTARQLERDADEVLKEFFEYANFTASVKKWTPELYEEVRGIADGSGHTFNEIFVLNLIDEFWVYLDNLRNHHCSGVGVPATSGHPAYIAQNMDIENYTDGYQILMRIKGLEDRPEQLILSHPGLIALNGLNSMSIGVCVNTLMQIRASSEGLPVAFVIRGILSSMTKDQALSFIKDVDHASGQNYIIGIGDEVFDFEVSAGKAVEFAPGNENGSLYHTNHPLANNDMKSWYAIYDPALDHVKDPSTSNSHSRLEALKKRFSDNESITKNTIIDALTSKDDIFNPVCRSRYKGPGGFTFASVIMTLGEIPCMEVTTGPPDESEYSRYDFSGTHK